MNTCIYNIHEWYLIKLWVSAVIWYVTKWQNKHSLKQTSKILNCSTSCSLSIIIELETLSNSKFALNEHIVAFCHYTLGFACFTCKTYVIDTPHWRNLYKRECYIMTIVPLPHIHETTRKFCVRLLSYQHGTCSCCNQQCNNQHKTSLPVMI